MATVQDCREALEKLDEQMAVNASEVRKKINLDRRMTCKIKDLGVTFRGRLAEGRLLDLTNGEDPDAKIRLTIASDDLIALIDGRLNFAQAWAKGQLSVKASFSDLLKLRNLL